MRDTDEILLRKMHAGSEPAAAMLWARHAAWMLGFARSVVGRRGGVSAEDVVQNVFLRVLTLDRGTIRAVREARPWLAALVRREALNQLRTLRRRHRRDAQAFAGATADAPAPSHGGSEVHAVLAAMPRRLREVVHLRHALGLTTEQTAQALGLPRGTVASRHHAAMTMLRAGVADPSRPPDSRVTRHPANSHGAVRHADIV